MLRTLGRYGACLCEEFVLSFSNTVSFDQSRGREDSESEDESRTGKKKRRVK